MKFTASEPLRHNLQILGLSAFAAQPLLDLLGRFPTFLVAHRATPADLTAVVLLVALALPLAGILVHWISWAISQTAHRLLHRLLVGALVALLFLPLLNDIAMPAPAVFALAIVAGGLVSIAAARLRALDTLLSVSSLALPAFVLIFLLRPSVQSLLRPHTSVQSAGGEASRNIDVIYLIYDALPMSSLLDESRRIDPLLYPNIAALARDGVAYYNFTSVSQKTRRSVPSMLTGVRSSQLELPDYSFYPENLFSLLQASHDLVVEEANTHLCPTDVFVQRGDLGQKNLGAILADLRVLYLHLILPEQSRENLPDVQHNWKGFADQRETVDELRERESENVERHRRFVSRIEPASRPTLYFLHTVLPHLPYQHFPSGTLYSWTGKEPIQREKSPGVRVDNDWATLHSYQRHLLQLGYVDRLVGEIVERLKSQGLYEDALILVSSDHGVSFKPGIHYRKLMKENFEDIAPVPLVVKYPAGERAGTESFENFEGIDLVPTIADVLGVEIPWHVGGHSIVDPQRQERPTKLIYGEAELTDQMELPGRLIEKQYETLERKLRHFGSGSDPHALFRLGDDHGLLGKPLAELEVLELASIPVHLRSPAMLEGIDPGDGFVPAEVIGYADGTAQELENLRIAVAMNGIVRALTKPYWKWEEREAAVWSALVPEESFRRGNNTVEALVLREDETGVRLERGREEGDGPSFLNMALGRNSFTGVEEEGIRGHTGAGRRWTDGHAKLVVPIRKGEKPSSVFLALSSGRKGVSTPVEIRITGAATQVVTLPGELTDYEVALPGPVGPALTIELISESFTRRGPEPGKPDPLRFGIQIREIRIR